MAKLKFKNSYESRGKKPEFYTKYKENKQMTDKSQIYSASITEMAKRYGIDAIISKAEKDYLDNQAITDKLYGYDLTNGFKSKEEMLNIKKRVNNLFENIPARMRKEYFNDNPMEFVNAYTTNDENKLTMLNKLGIVSDSQLENVKKYNKDLKEARNEQILHQQFVQKLEESQKGLYENFKQTGNIIINNSTNNTKTNTDV